MLRRLPNFAFILLAFVLIVVFSFLSTGTAVAKGKVVIGLLCPLTGPYSFEAESEVNFARLAAEEINAAGGILGRKIKIISQGKKGRIIIEYYSLDDLENLIKALSK